MSQKKKKEKITKETKKTKEKPLTTTFKEHTTRDLYKFSVNGQKGKKKKQIDNN